MDMIWATYIIPLATWLAFSMAEKPTSDPKEVSTACDENWIFSEGNCYFFSEPEDSINPKDAEDRCHLYDAEHAYAKSGRELKFLQSQAKARDTYGWALNLQKDYYSGDFSRIGTNVFSGHRKFFTPNPDTIPDTQKAYDKDEECIALHVGRRVRYSWSTRATEVTTEPCEVKLWVACQGKKSDFPDQVIDYERWFSHEDLVFWLSGNMADQAEARTLCKKEGMELIINLKDLMAGLNGTYDLTPWWVGFTLGKDGPRMPEDTTVKVDLLDLTRLTWLSESETYGYGNVILLHSGNARFIEYENHETAALPYICKKRASAKGLFGCPNLWIRAGRSCYYLSYRQKKTWHDAKKSCEVRKSHLLSINSLDERLWIETVALKDMRLTWTSANDLNNEGNFRWHDGSKIDNVIFPWMKAPFDESNMLYQYRCAAFYPSNSYLYVADCMSEMQAACQYALSEGETKCEDKWEKLDGNCYFIDKEDEKWMSYERNDQYCRNLIKHSHAHPILVKTKEVADNLAKFWQDGSRYTPFFWLGMKLRDTFDSWTWKDGSKVDFSVFGLKDQPDNGSGDDPENCVTMNQMLHASDSKCNNMNAYICEQDLAPVTALGPKPGSASYVRMVPVVTMVSVLISFLTVRWS